MVGDGHGDALAPRPPPPPTWGPAALPVDSWILLVRSTCGIRCGRGVRPASSGDYGTAHATGVQQDRQSEQTTTAQRLRHTCMPRRQPST
jgi:hypothetical protein